MTQKEVSADKMVVFMTLIPDDYHGAPSIANLSEEFILPPTNEEVYDAWHEAGYNPFAQADEDDPDPEAYFEQYGDGTGYYATYILVVSPDYNYSLDRIRMKMEENIGDSVNIADDNAGGPKIERIVEILLEFHFITEVLPIPIKL